MPSEAFSIPVEIVFVLRDAMAVGPPRIVPADKFVVLILATPRDCSWMKPVESIFTFKVERKFAVFPTVVEAYIDAVLIVL